MRTTVARTALAIVVALTLATATAQKDFEDVTTGMFHDLEATDWPASRLGISPKEATYIRCGMILDTLTTVNKGIIARHFENAGYTLMMPWETELIEWGAMHVAGFGRPERGRPAPNTLWFVPLYIEDFTNDASAVCILADWAP